MCSFNKLVVSERSVVSDVSHISIKMSMVLLLVKATARNGLVAMCIASSTDDVLETTTWMYSLDSSNIIIRAPEQVSEENIYLEPENCYDDYSFYIPIHHHICADRVSAARLIATFMPIESSASRLIATFVLIEF